MIWHFNEKAGTGGPPLTLFFGTAEKNHVRRKTVLEEDFLSTIYYKNGTTEFLRKNPVREKSALEEDFVRGGPYVACCISYFLQLLRASQH